MTLIDKNTTFWGYRRENGRVGVRNHVIILPLDDLSNAAAEARLVLVGHALMEKLVVPRKPMVAHVYQAPVAIESIANMDAWLAQEIQPQPWAAKPFSPLPVLGVPGWWPANEVPGFYADTQVFRPPR